MRVGLRTRITVAMLVLALVPLGVVTWQLARRSATDLQAEINQYQIATADLVHAAIRALIREVTSDAEGIGLALAPRDASLDQRIAAAMIQLQASFRVHQVGLYGPDGRLLDGLVAPAAKERLPTPETLPPEALEVAQDQREVFLDLVSAPSGALYQPVVVPVFRGEPPEIFLYVRALAPLSVISEEVRMIQQRRFEENAGVVWVLDSGLRVVAAADPARVGQSAQGHPVAPGLDRYGGELVRELATASTYEHEGQEVMGTLAPVSDLAWGIVVEVPAAVALRAVQLIWRDAAILAGLFALLALGLGLWIGGRLAAPVVEVSKAAGRVAAGDFEAAVPVRTTDETGDLARSFNQMATDLRGYRDRLVEETRIRNNLSRFLSPDVVEQVVEKGEDLSLGGQRMRVTVLFADVVAFTPLAEARDPEFIVGVLNEMFTFLTEIVFRHGGIVDKFIGDSVMAVFGAPYAMEDDAVSAVSAAEEMVRWLEVGNAKWRGDLGRDLEIAIGINSGEVVAGNIGSERRMDYTVIGDVVNIAARLESIAQPGQVVMTRATMEAVADEFDCEPLGDVKLSGRSENTEIFLLAP